MPTAGNEAPAGYRHAMRWAQIASAGALWAALACAGMTARGIPAFAGQRRIFEFTCPVAAVNIRPGFTF